jgi:hypothetical protein
MLPESNNRQTLTKRETSPLAPPVAYLVACRPRPMPQAEYLAIGATSDDFGCSAGRRRRRIA